MALSCRGSIGPRAEVPRASPSGDTVTREFPLLREFVGGDEGEAVRQWNGESVPNRSTRTIRDVFRVPNLEDSYSIRPMTIFWISLVPS